LPDRSWTRPASPSSPNAAQSQRSRARRRLPHPPWRSCTTGCWHHRRRVRWPAGARPRRPRAVPQSTDARARIALDACEPARLRVDAAGLVAELGTQLRATHPLSTTSSGDVLDSPFRRFPSCAVLEGGHAVLAGPRSRSTRGEPSAARRSGSDAAEAFHTRGPDVTWRHRW